MIYRHASPQPQIERPRSSIFIGPDVMSRSTSRSGKVGVDGRATASSEMHTVLLPSDPPSWPRGICPPITATSLQDAIPKYEIRHIIQRSA